MTQRRSATALGVLIEACFERSHPPAEIFGGGMAVMIGDILAEPAPERLDWHEVGAVAGQRHEVDVEPFGRFTHHAGAMIGGHAGAMIGGAIPHDDQLVFGLIQARSRRRTSTVWLWPLARA